MHTVATEEFCFVFPFTSVTCQLEPCHEEFCITTWRRHVASRLDLIPALLAAIQMATDRFCPMASSDQQLKCPSGSIGKRGKRLDQLDKKRIALEETWVCPNFRICAQKIWKMAACDREFSNCWVLNLHSTAHLESTAAASFTAALLDSTFMALSRPGWSGFNLICINTTALVLVSALQHWFSFFPGTNIFDLVVFVRTYHGFALPICWTSQKILRRQKVWRYLWLWWLWWPESAAQLVGWKVRLLGWLGGFCKSLFTPWHGKHLWWNDVCEQQYVHIYIYIYATYIYIYIHTCTWPVVKI